MKRSLKITFFLIVGLLLAGTGYVTAAGEMPGMESFRGSRSLTVEVAENGTRFSPDAEPLDGNGFPVYGTEFITQGYIYPEGTLTCDNNSCNGVNPDGTPEFPDQVIGLWTCRGWFVDDAATTATGPWVITTQTYSLGQNPGLSPQIVTDGFELADLNTPYVRAITGGTAQYRNARGVQTQELLGFNASFGTTIRVTFEMRR